MFDYNKDFDFIDFSSKIIKTVDSIRSLGKEGASKEPVESRINAFYRALGLPAMKIGNKYDEFNNGNIFESTDEALKGKLEGRETLSKNLPVLIESGKIAAPLDFNISSVKDSITPSMVNRPQLFPMVVFDNVMIMPTQNRVAGAFMTAEERTHDKKEYHVPFIEFVLTLKLNAEGFTNTSTQGNVSTSSSVVLKEFKSINEDIVKQIELSLENIGKGLTEAKAKIDKARMSTGMEISQDPSGHAEQNTKTEDDQASKAALDKLIKEQDRIIALKHARLMLFDFDDTTIEGPDAQAGATTRNLKKAILSSSFLDLALSDSGSIATAQKESTKKKEKVEAELKKANGELDFILGSFSGLSGSDVMAVIYAILTVKKETLMALLNDKSFARLNEKFGKKLSKPNMKMLDAVKDLQDAVTKTITDKIFKSTEDISTNTDKTK